jgi:DNA repair exonuclease SbcCD ATPase subunit
LLSTQTNAVYTSRDQALDDLTRLHKLNDFDGIKLRVMQIYRERTDLEDLTRDSCKLAEWYLQEAEKREMAVSEAREAARKGQDEANALINGVRQQKQESEMNYKRLTMALTEKLSTLENNLERLQEDKDRLERMQPQIEGLTVERDKAEVDMKRYREENERLRAHYEVLKEHELNLIKDYESKIQREQLMAEQRLNGMHDDIRQT